MREAREGQRPRLLPVARAGVRVLPVVTVVTFVSGVGTYLGAILVVPAIVLLFRWSVAAQVAAIDNGGWKEALQSSRLLAIDRWGQIFVLFIFLGIPTLIPWLVLHHLFPRDSTTVVSVAGGVAYSILTRSIFALGTAFLFFDLRDSRPEATSANAHALIEEMKAAKATRPTRKPPSPGGVSTALPPPVAPR